jgi:hypothetical protein
VVLAVRVRYPKVGVARRLPARKRRVGMGSAAFTGVRVFSTTLARDREAMGENITKWIRDNPQFEVVDRVVTQSSDKEFHCLTITLFYRERPIDR